MDHFFEGALGAWAPVLVNAAIIAAIVTASLHHLGKRWTEKRTTRFTVGLSIGLGLFAHALPDALLPKAEGWQGWVLSGGVGAISFLVGAGFSPMSALSAVKREAPKE